jgi:hypothetical protein
VISLIFDTMGRRAMKLRHFFVFQLRQLDAASHVSISVRLVMEESTVREERMNGILFDTVLAHQCWKMSFFVARRTVVFLILFIARWDIDVPIVRMINSGVIENIDPRIAPL